MDDNPRGVILGLLAMSLGQKIFYGLAIITWLGGGMTLSLHSRRRLANEGHDSLPRGRPHLNRREWFILALLAITAVTFGRIGLSFAGR